MMKAKDLINATIAGKDPSKLVEQVTAPGRVVLHSFGGEKTEQGMEVGSSVKILAAGEYKGKTGTIISKESPRRILVEFPDGEQVEFSAAQLSLAESRRQRHEQDFEVPDFQVGSRIRLKTGGMAMTPDGGDINVEADETGTVIDILKEDEMTGLKQSLSIELDGGESVIIPFAKAELIEGHKREQDSGWRVVASYPLSLFNSSEGDALEDELDRLGQRNGGLYLGSGAGSGTRDVAFEFPSEDQAAAFASAAEALGDVAVEAFEAESKKHEFGDRMEDRKREQDDEDDDDDNDDREMEAYFREEEAPSVGDVIEVKGMLPDNPNVSIGEVISISDDGINVEWDDGGISFVPRGDISMTGSGSWVYNVPLALSHRRRRGSRSEHFRKEAQLQVDAEATGEQPKQLGAAISDFLQAEGIENKVDADGGMVLVDISNDSDVKEAMKLISQFFQAPVQAVKMGTEARTMDDDDDEEDDAEEESLKREQYGNDDDDDDDDDKKEQVTDVIDIEDVIDNFGLDVVAAEELSFLVSQRANKETILQTLMDLGVDEGEAKDIVKELMDAGVTEQVNGDGEDEDEEEDEMEGVILPAHVTKELRQLVRQRPTPEQVAELLLQSGQMDSEEISKVLRALAKKGAFEAYTKEQGRVDEPEVGDPVMAPDDENKTGVISNKLDDGSLVVIWDEGEEEALPASQVKLIGVETSPSSDLSSGVAEARLDEASFLAHLQNGETVAFAAVDDLEAIVDARRTYGDELVRVTTDETDPFVLWTALDQSLQDDEARKREQAASDDLMWATVEFIRDGDPRQGEEAVVVSTSPLVIEFEDGEEREVTPAQIRLTHIEGVSPFNFDRVEQVHQESPGVDVESILAAFDLPEDVIGGLQDLIDRGASGDEIDTFLADKKVGPMESSSIIDTLMGLDTSSASF